jgi:ribosomal protein S18 acetylase RimI-like enzyme
MMSNKLSASGRIDPWPVVNEADLVYPDHPELRFVAVTDGFRYSVHALYDLVCVGSLRWMIPDPEKDDDAGLITWVEVSPKLRRRGIATALRRAATDYAEHHGLPAPRHSDSRTPLGEAWATSLGAPRAKEIRDWEEES